jgi:uncharacterized SAM-binding protein YcdF (DUF218 family)
MSPRLNGVLEGAIIGALLWAGLEELGVWAALKSDFYIGPLALSIIIGGVAGAIPLLRRVLWVGAAVTVLLLAIVSYTPLAGALAHPMVRADTAPAGKLDAIVVLSGGVTGDSAMSTQTLDRVLKGAQLAREGRAGALVLSRESLRRSGRAVTDAEDEASVLALVQPAVPVFFIDSASSTRDEALRVKRLNSNTSWKRIGLVTSPLHSRRACAVFERAGFVVTCMPAASRDRSIRNLDAPADRLRVFQGWVYEMAGTTNYRLKGWI